ncbi:alpha/beta hydrolase [Glutamicibacter sp. MNS18]|uniref:alpha/beta fold hydrolase n=1 Tax=Glutamicibacter sp. MNS18 TaxID=2989817 RepID=UPI0022356F7C|nr:alpha/beta hydrolase [Glutamicibacter sp. MNS18]MCW4464752.1 alpha/beta hydrolase [Glutamicibacter sp. MNS18]
METHHDLTTQWLPRPEGRLAYTVQGAGPLIIALPGMGDLRQTWDAIIPALVAAGYQVAAMDLRGHGQSDTTFNDHGDLATAEDFLALAKHLGKDRVILLGNSMAGSAAVVAAGMDPHRIAAAVMVNGFLREPGGNPSRYLLHMAYRLLFSRPWGAACWSGYYRSLNKGAAAPGLETHLQLIRTSLSDPHRLRSFRQLCLQLDHRQVADWAAKAAAPTLAIYGQRDPDFKDLDSEMQLARRLLDASTVVMPDSGHYPQHQHPGRLAELIVDFLSREDSRG